MVVEYTSNTTDVRELSSSVITTVFPNDEIIEEQKAAYNYIAIYTHKFDWSVLDKEFPSIQKLEAQLTKCYIFEHYGGSKYYEYVDREKAKIDKALDKIVDNMSSIDPEEEDRLTRTDLKSWNINQDNPYYSKLSRSLRADTMGVND